MIHYLLVLFHAFHLMSWIDCAARKRSLALISSLFHSGDMPCRHNPPKKEKIEGDRQNPY